MSRSGERDRAGKPTSKRSLGARPMLAVIAVLATGGAIAAWIGHRHNAERAAQYSADASCHRSIERSLPTTSLSSACSSERASITARYVHTYKGSHYYRLALRTRDGVVDSIELKSAKAKDFWNATSLGGALNVERFTDAPPAKRHVTLVSLNGVTSQTEWNPAWQAHNTAFGVWSLTLVAVLSIFGFLWLQARTK